MTPAANTLHRLTRCTFSAGALLTVLGLSAPAAAETAEPVIAAALQREAQARYDEGVLAYRRGQYEQAVALFIVADRLLPSPALAYNIAQAYEKQHATAEALDYYREFLRRAPKADNRQEVAVRVAALEVVLDHKKQQKAAAVVEKSAVATATSAPTSSVSTVPASAASVQQSSQLSSSPPRADAERGPSVPVLVTGGALSVAGIAAGVAFELAARSADADLARFRSDLGPAGCVATPRPAACDSVREAAERHDRNHTWAVGSFVAGSLIGVGTATYWLLTGTASRSEGRARAVELGGAVTQEGASVSLAGQF